jgi:hypothetical protein
MASDYAKAAEQWARYVYARESHRAFIAKANRCEEFVCGNQWRVEDLNELRNARRPALTLNKMLITLASIFGEQIDLRSETGFKPRYGSDPKSADILTKVFRYIADDNMLNWVRTDVFMDGMITSRGYFDVRMRFDRNVAGEVQIGRLNPRAVLPDPDASDYHPEKWNDVTVTTWATERDAETVYGKEIAKALASRAGSVWDEGEDSLDTEGDRFGQGIQPIQRQITGDPEVDRTTARNIRILDRQFRDRVRRKYFVNPRNGDKSPVPDGWDRDMIAMVVERTGFAVVDELGERVRWRVTAEDMVLHDDWSPFDRHFTVVPYFPFFRHGRTVGVAETLIDPQELLNKSTSQELHVVNTMANSGWIVRRGGLMNLTPDELEEWGAKTGLVIEVQNDVTKDVMKIQPNQIPQGLDRLSFKAENYIKSISGRGDSQLGLDRADVSGKAIGEKKESSDVNLRGAMDALERTDHMMAHVILYMVQNYYTDPRIMTITRSDVTNEYETIEVNVPDPTTGEVVNDLSKGMYDVVVTSQNAKRTLEESEFQQALALRELGIAIPDRFLIQHSNMRKKGDIIKAMDAEAASPENQMRRHAENLEGQLRVAKTRGEVSKLEATAVAQRAKAAKTMADAAQVGEEPGAEEQLAIAEREFQLKEREHEQKLRHEQEMHEQKMQLQAAEAAEKRRAQRIQAAVAAKRAAAKPQQPGATA